MKSYIGANIVVEDPSQEILDWCETELVLSNPLYLQMKRLGKDELIRRRHIPEKTKLYAKKRNSIQFPFGCLNAVWRFVSKYPYETEFNNAGKLSIANDTTKIEFFDYQEEAINEMVKAKGGVLVSQCGSGKTYMGIEIIKRIGKKALWLCGTGDLLRQAKTDMLDIYPNLKIGLTTEGELEIGEDITISTVQTLSKVNPMLYKDEFDTIICDECSHVASDYKTMAMYTRVLSEIPARYKYGLTATPTRADGLIKSMYAFLGTHLNGIWGYGIFEPTFTVNRSKVRTMRAVHEKVEIRTYYENMEEQDIYDTSGMIDYNALISSLTANKERNEQIVKNIVKCSQNGRKQVILSLRVEHCETLIEMLREKGVNAFLCVGKTKAKDREDILKQRIKWDVLVSTYALLKEGVSVKELDTLHLTTPIKEDGMVVQAVGRIERELEGKKQPIVYDYVDMDIPYCEKAYIKRRRALKRRF